ncbi:restriction endonuclease [Sphingomonas sp. HF-S4]|uniref:Restriction endonuclease n=1 Tax=Sphingomonas agrestis TaxID=3080540 RepID=A0ABU3YD20_9SPHN|nr:restriction endonuclease [Sphingomonas sp. HF-S4]MDV3459236.1 restriction endonuclease [Sphingomonas sp. HF-S4]
MLETDTQGRITAAQAALDELKEGGASISPRDAEQLLGDAIGPLLETSGYALERTAAQRDKGMDFLARRPATTDADAVTIAIELKHTRARMSVSAIRQLVGAAMMAGVDRAVLVSNAGFSQSAHEAIRQSLPVRIELLSYDGLVDWTRAIASERKAPDRLSQGIKMFSRFLAIEIARDPSALERLEWYHIEPTIAEIFDGLGFQVTLTPPAKDGGKDVILAFTLNGKAVEYYVEVKHWRSATKVGSGAVSDFIEVIARDKVAGGLFLSTHGYTGNAFEYLTQLDRERIRFEGRDKVLTLCQTYSKAQAGLWSPPASLREILHEKIG